MAVTKKVYAVVLTVALILNMLLLALGLIPALAFWLVLAALVALAYPISRKW